MKLYCEKDKRQADLQYGGLCSVTMELLWKTITAITVTFGYREPISRYI